MHFEMERLFNAVQQFFDFPVGLPDELIPGFRVSAALGNFSREKRAKARFSRIYVTLICGIICPLYIIYYYISVRTDLYARRIFHFILQTRNSRGGFIANNRFTRWICLEFDFLLVFIGVRTLVRRTGGGVKIKYVCVFPN